MPQRTQRNTALLIGLLVVLPLLAAAYVRAATLIPLGTTQDNIRTAYRTSGAHSREYGRLHWAQQPFVLDDTRYPAGTLIAPDGISGTGFTSRVLSETIAVRPALAVHAVGTRIALLRSTVSDPAYGNAAWELADFREVLENYLDGELRYDILDEATLATADLSRYRLVIAPAVRWGNEADVLAALPPAALANLAAFVRGGGFLYAQSNGAIVAEAAGLLPPGTVDLTAPLELAPDEPLNTGTLRVLDATAPLAYTWLTDTLYLLTSPTYRPSAGLQTIADYTNLADGEPAPAIVSGQVGLGRVILVNGHPTAPTQRSQLPIFMNAVFWALGSPAELYGQAIQTYNPQLDPTLLPGYEQVPISATLSFNNLWDTPLREVVITETIAPGFTVLPDTIRPYAGVYATYQVSVITSTTGTQIVWRFADVPTGTLDLAFQAVTDLDTLQSGLVTFATGTAAFQHENRPYRIQHQPFQFTARMSARLLADRDLELDRMFGIPSAADGGLIFDVAVPIENKEDSPATDVVLSDVVVCLAPILALDDQETIVGQNNGETIWIHNEPFFYNEPDAPYRAPDGYAPGDSIALDECDGPPAEYAVPFGVYGEVVTDSVALDPQRLQGFGNYITIPISYSQYISLTERNTLLLPTKVLTWTLGGWAGYHYEEPAIRYGIQSEELFGRRVTFAGDPGIAPTDVVIQGTAGSVYTHAGDPPIPYDAYVASRNVAFPQSDQPTQITYRDLWTRPHTVTLRSAFFDLFSWASCQCDPNGASEQHARMNVTFGMQADLNRDGTPESDVLLFPSRLEQTHVDILIKNRSEQDTIRAGEMLVDLGMFRGLGVQIGPRNGTWQQSYRSNTNAQLVEVVREAGYDRLLFQHGIAPASTQEMIVEAILTPFPGRTMEGMLKLHDGARLVYRQPFAGQNRYEVYDSRVQGIVGAAAELSIRKQGTPIQISTYGDTLYYIITLDDPSEPRTLRRNGAGDPFLQSYGFGTSAATTYVGGREGREILHSVVAPGERTRIRVELNNNTAQDWRNVVVLPQAPAGITITRSYAPPYPAPLFADIPFLYLETIPSVGRAVYYFDVDVDRYHFNDTYGVEPTGQRLAIPITVTGAGLPDDFQIAPAQLGIALPGAAVTFVSSPAQAICLSDYLPPEVTLTGAALAQAADVTRLTEATDADAKAAIFAGLEQRLAPRVDAAGQVQFDLPTQAWAHLYAPLADDRVRLVAQATVRPTQAGPLLANYGATAVYTDEFGVAWQGTSAPFIAEVSGAVIRTSYTCAGVVSPASTDPRQCLLAAGSANTVDLVATIANVGDYLAQDVTASLILTDGLTVVSTTPLAATQASTLTWQLGDLAPGGFGRVRVQVQVALNAAGQPLPVLPTLSDQQLAPVALIVRSEGEFFETFTQRWIAAPFGDGYALPAVLGATPPITPTVTPTAPTETPVPATATPTAGIPSRPTMPPTTTPPATPVAPTTPPFAAPALRIAYECVGIQTEWGSAECVLEPNTLNQVRVRVRLSNIGAADAPTTQLQLGLPAGIQLLHAEPPLTNGPRGASWLVGDLEAGTSRSLFLTLGVPLNRSPAVAQGSLPREVLLIETATASYQVAGQAVTVALPSGYTLPVRSAEPLAQPPLSLSVTCMRVQTASPSSLPPCTLQAGTANTVTLRLQLRNTGAYTTAAISLRSLLGEQVQLVAHAAHPFQTDANAIVWQLAELGPTQSRETTLTLRVTPAATSAQQTYPVLTRSFATYRDRRDNQPYQQPLYPAYALPLQPIQIGPVAQNLSFLPIVRRAASSTPIGDPVPDLIVTDLRVAPANLDTNTPARISVTVQNVGTAAARGFWVDLFIAPQPVPTQTGLRWDMACGLEPCQGIVWAVQGLDVGEQIVLTSDADQIAAAYSNWDGQFALPGTHDLYVLADSWNEADLTHGAVRELREDNNVLVLRGLPITGSPRLLLPLQHVPERPALR